MNYWPWILFCAEIVGIGALRLTAVTGKWWGWLIVLTTMSVPWFIYALTTQQWGFMALTALWAITYIANAAHWKKKGKQ